MERPGIEGPGSAQLDVAAENADLGLPPPRRSIFRRLMARASWSTSRHQVTYNHSIVEALAAMSHAIEVTRTSTATDVGNLLGEYQAALADLQLRIGELAGLVDAREVDLHDLRSRVAMVTQRQTVTEAAPRTELAQPREGAMPAPPSRALDESLMAALEDQFRPLEQRRRTADDHLLEVFTTVGDDGTVLDIGCGTGEWLRTLHDAGVDARGIDTSALAVETCKAAGLEATEEDAITHLERADEGSLAVVTAFHVVEHLATSDLVAVLDGSLRALRPGGLLVLETPNPMNLRVGAATFWLDPTHVRPIPPALLEFVARHRGFDGVEIHLLHPVEDDLDLDRLETAIRDSIDPFAARMVELLSGAQDYALYARTPSASGATT